MELESVLDRYEEEEGADGAEVSGISISVCVNTSNEQTPGLQTQTSTHLTVDRRLPHQRYSK